ncbi:MAG TPA: hypothetical protein DEF47_16685 [Herpetosiphon sp.]|uniref:Uncharacterized protein n=1 Tax=Herpetosiphon aurantiacus (strain ATCC 23779 / DSM 785 / 114-95) TaxID=316274 RepID=A9B015_HERA2|nr:hypothetical protein [Herpetosiphon sp.]ABX03722.1 hypothetical protein Haur_1074 [Herpetosiphon aurantiacus DSM 785]HBW51533.1 hypothetical protein [Herpetosiphon sp.]
MLQTFLSAELTDQYYLLQACIDFETSLIVSQTHTVLKTLLAILDRPYAAAPELGLVGIGCVMLTQKNLTIKLCFTYVDYDEYQHHQRVNFVFHLLAIIGQQFPFAQNQFYDILKFWLDAYQTEYLDD